MCSMRLFACEILTQEFQLQNECAVYSVYLPLGGVLAKKKKKNLPSAASVASLRCNFLLYISSSAVWEACYSCRCHKKRLSLSLLPPFRLALHVFAALILRQVLQPACSVGSPCLIVLLL